MVHTQCIQTANKISGLVVWCGVHKEYQPTESHGRVSYPQELEGWSKESTLLFVDRTLGTNYQRQCFEGCPIQ